MKKSYGTTTFRTAVDWLNGNLILQNNIMEIDPEITFRFNTVDEDGDNIDIFQWYLTSYSLSDVEFLEKTFGLDFAYSELLDNYILCVTHYGTSWSYVSNDVYDEDVWNVIVNSKETYKDLTGYGN